MEMVGEIPLNKIEGKEYNILKINPNYRKANYKVSFYKDRVIGREEELSDIDLTVIYKVDKNILKKIRKFENVLACNKISYEYSDLVYDCCFNGSSDIVFKDNNIITVVYKCKGHVYHPREDYSIDFKGDLLWHNFYGVLKQGTKVDLEINNSEENPKDFCLHIEGYEDERILNTISFKGEDFNPDEDGVKILSSIGQIIGIDIDKINIDDFIVVPYQGIRLSWDKEMADSGYTVDIIYRSRI